jgi:hypothetical protein
MNKITYISFNLNYYYNNEKLKQVVTIVIKQELIKGNTFPENIYFPLFTLTSFENEYKEVINEYMKESNCTHYYKGMQLTDDKKGLVFTYQDKENCPTAIQTITVNTADENLSYIGLLNFLRKAVLISSEKISV